MTVRYRSGASLRGGWTWGANVPYTSVKNFVPCVEHEWNDIGMVTRTGRLALLTFDDCSKSQQACTPDQEPERWLDDDDPRIVTREEWTARKRFLDAGLRVDGKVPERLLCDAESPF